MRYRSVSDRVCLPGGALPHVSRKSGLERDCRILTSRASGVRSATPCDLIRAKARGLAQQAPLTPEYQALFEASLKDQAAGGEGLAQTNSCVSPGMPRVTNGYGPMEVIVTPRTTYIMVEHINDNRRIYTDGRDWPTELEPTYLGYSIGRWIDTDGDGRYDVLEVETRGFKGPRTYDDSGIPLHEDNLTIVRERIYLDKSDPNIFHDEVAVIDHALTQPLDRDQELPSRARSPALLARGHLRRDQQPRGDRKAELHGEPGRTTHADEEGPASPRPAIFQSLPQAGTIDAIRLLCAFLVQARRHVDHAHIVLD